MIIKLVRYVLDKLDFGPTTSGCTVAAQGQRNVRISVRNRIESKDIRELFVCSSAVFGSYETLTCSYLQNRSGTIL